MSEERTPRARVLAWAGRARAADAFAVPALSPLWDWLRAQLALEAGPGRLMPWIPVAFGAGIALYFAADREPVAGFTVGFASLLIVGAGLMRHRRGFAMLALLAAFVAGFAAATLKTARISHDVLARPIYTPSIAGFVETHEERERTDRFVLRVTAMETPRGVAALSRVRLSVKKGTAPAVSSFVELKARLLPPLQPLRPGSYDFARDMYFQGIGASGFAMGAITVREPPGAGGFALSYATAMQNLRDAIDARIRTVMSGDARAIATALLTGRRDAISPSVNDAMFISGLGHVLSISGYHMAVVAGIVFFAVRALLALVPTFSASAPIKKWAAVAAFLAAAFYLALSGAEVATQRSFVMTGVVLVAVMLDRRAITFRTLAIAAMAVLVLTPEAIVHPSFQMSFAATLGLVALVNVGLPKFFAAADRPATARAALWGGRELMMLTLASLVAGLATTPYAAFHFHRLTPYGVLANLAAMPVVSAIVMPAGILGLVAMPFGLDRLCWQIMDLGIGWMIAVTQAVAALPGAVGRVAAFGIGPMILASAGLILLGLLRTPLRWSGALVLVASIWWIATAPRPDVLIAGDGMGMAVRSADGRLRILGKAKDTFQLREWLAADADHRAANDPSLQDGVSCDEAGCVVPMTDGKLAAWALKPEALADDCAEATIVVSPYAVPAGCAAHSVTRGFLQDAGAMALYRSRGGFTREAIRPPGVSRPWSPASPSQMAEGSMRRRETIDATPAEIDQRPDD